MNFQRKLSVFLVGIGCAATALAGTAHYGFSGLGFAAISPQGGVLPDQTCSTSTPTLTILYTCSPGFSDDNAYWKPCPFNNCKANVGFVSVNRPGDGNCVNGNGGCIWAVSVLGYNSAGAPGTQCDGGSGLCSFRDSAIAEMTLTGKGGL